MPTVWKPTATSVNPWLERYCYRYPLDQQVDEAIAEFLPEPRLYSLTHERETSRSLLQLSERKRDQDLLEVFIVPVNSDQVNAFFDRTQRIEPCVGG